MHVLELVPVRLGASEGFFDGVQLELIGPNGPSQRAEATFPFNYGNPLCLTGGDEGKWR